MWQHYFIFKHYTEKCLWSSDFAIILGLAPPCGVVVLLHTYAQKETNFNVYNQEGIILCQMALHNRCIDNVNFQCENDNGVNFTD